MSLINKIKKSVKTRVSEYKKAKEIEREIYRRAYEKAKKKALKKKEALRQREIKKRAEKRAEWETKSKLEKLKDIGAKISEGLKEYEQTDRPKSKRKLVSNDLFNFDAILGGSKKKTNKDNIWESTDDYFDRIL